MASVTESNQADNNKTNATLQYTPARIYTSFPETKYLLPADEEEKQRLNLQHRILRDLFEGNIIAPITLQSESKVLECATGTAVWLTEVAETLPKSVIFYGIDIESRNCPPAETLSKNIHLSKESILALPPHWNSHFNFVNVRLLMAALQTTDWLVACGEIYRVLAPGGWVQLCEAGDWNGGPLSMRHKEITRALFTSRNLLLECAKELPLMLKNIGFEKITVVDRPTPLGKWAGQLGIDGAKNLMSVWKGMKEPCLKAGGFGMVKSEEELDSLLAGLEAEWDETPGSEIYWVAIYAQKPLSNP